MTFEEAKNYYGEAFNVFFEFDTSFNKVDESTDPEKAQEAVNTFEDVFYGEWQDKEAFCENYIEVQRFFDDISESVRKFFYVNYEELVEDMFSETGYKAMPLSTGWIAVFRNF